MDSFVGFLFAPDYMSIMDAKYKKEVDDEDNTTIELQINSFGSCNEISFHEGPQEAYEQYNKLRAK